MVGTDYDDSAKWAVDLAAEEGYRYVHPGNERLVIAGTGTAGLEIVESLPDIEGVLGPVGAGSIGAGYSLSVEIVTDAEVIGVQAANVDAAYQAWWTGELVPQAEADTVADGIAARVPYAIPVQVMREHLDAFSTVDDEAAIGETVASMFDQERILMEGACAPPIAVLEKLRDEIAGRTVAIPVGRNLTGTKVERILSDR